MFGTKELDYRKLENMLNDLHIEDDCDGKWELEEEKNVTYRLDTRVLILDRAFFAVCKKCGAKHFYPGFEDAVKRSYARALLSTDGMLTKPALRFLRTYSGKTQKEMGAYFGISKDEYNKFESIKNTTRKLNPDRQARIKVIFADLLNIEDIEIYRRLGYIIDDKEADIPRKLKVQNDYFLEAN